jgi:hypothetical protein
LRRFFAFLKVGECNGDLNEAAGAADACACPMQAASKIRGWSALARSGIYRKIVFR